MFHLNVLKQFFFKYSFFLIHEYVLYRLDLFIVKRIDIHIFNQLLKELFIQFILFEIYFQLYFSRIMKYEICFKISRSQNAGLLSVLLNIQFFFQGPKLILLIILIIYFIDIKSLSTCIYCLTYLNNYTILHVI